jgi:hypothetical protein
MLSHVYTRAVQAFINCFQTPSQTRAQHSPPRTNKSLFLSFIQHQVSLAYKGKSLSDEQTTTLNNKQTRQNINRRSAQRNAQPTTGPDLANRLPLNAIPQRHPYARARRA